MPQREGLLNCVASEIRSLEKSYTLVAVDGVDGAGKTCFADELAVLLGEVVIRASVDSFHNPRAVRYAKGKHSPLGYFADSFNYSKLRELLLDPLSEEPPKRYCSAFFDYRIDSEVLVDWMEPAERGILILDGIFLHRPEVVEYWDYSIFLEVSPNVSVQRCIDREGFTDVSYDPRDKIHSRYVEGQAIYLEVCDPLSKCTRRIANENLDGPSVVV